MDLLDNIPIEIFVSFNIMDTLNIDSIYIQVGSSLNSSDIIATTAILFDPISSTPIGYIREENTISLDIGEYSNIENLYGLIYFKNNQGHSSETVSFSTEE